MKTKTLVIAIALIFVAGGGLLLAMRSGSTDSATTAEHDETNSDNHHSTDTEDIGEIVDLTAQSEVSMDIKDFKYGKPNIKIKKGTTVTWTNRDSMAHNVMQEHEDAEKAHNPPIKSEVKSDVFASQLLAKGESYSFTFTKVSTDPYHCSPHPYMKGSVTVVE